MGQAGPGMVAFPCVISSWLFEDLAACCAAFERNEPFLTRSS